MILTTWERITLLTTIQNQKGDFGIMRKCERLTRIIDFTPDETTEIKLTLTDNRYTWQNPSREWDITLAPADHATLSEWLTLRQWAAPEAKQALALALKFGIE